MEKTELAKAYVQIIPSAKGIGGMLQNEVGGETDAAGKSLGGRIGGAIKVAVIAAGIGKAISASISEGAELEQSIGGIETLFKDSAETTGIIVFLIGVSSIMAWILAFTGIPAAISNALLGISNNKIVILLIINVILLVVGTFMDITPAILIFTPIFLPVVTSDLIGMTAIQFGIMLVFNLCIGTITPPVGNILFVGVRVAKTSIERVIKPLLPYYGVIILVLLLVTFVPAISMFLP